MPNHLMILSHLLLNVEEKDISVQGKERLYFLLFGTKTG
jgi:hypothetical protein